MLKRGLGLAATLLVLSIIAVVVAVVLIYLETSGGEEVYIRVIPAVDTRAGEVYVSLSRVKVDAGPGGGGVLTLYFKVTYNGSGHAVVRGVDVVSVSTLEGARVLEYLGPSRVEEVKLASGGSTVIEAKFRIMEGFRVTEVEAAGRVAVGYDPYNSEYREPYTGEPVKIVLDKVRVGVEG